MSASAPTAVLLAGLWLGTGAAAMTPRPVDPAARRYEVDRVDGIAIVQLYADAFASLPREQRLLAYHLSRAALAGRDIAYDQNHRRAVEIRRLLEQIAAHPAGIPADRLERLREYLKNIWIHGSHYHQRTREKLMPRFTYRELRGAARRARGNGARLPPDPGLDALLEGLRPTMFDRGFEPLAIDRDPPPGRDLLTASANNFYAGISLAEANGFPERYPLNSRLVKDGEGIREEVYRAGGGGLPPGRYAAELTAVIGHLEAALPLTGHRQGESLRHLIAFLRGGDPEEFRRHSIAWLGTESPVDLILGFIEVYRDPRGLKGAFEGVVFIADPETTDLVKTLAAEAAHFEAGAPWGDKYRRREFPPPVARGVQVLMATGDGGPMCPTGINLPNSQEIRQTHGSKSVLLANVLEATRGSAGGRLVAEFALPEERGRARALGPRVERLQVAMHEVLGHASGKVADELAGDPAEYLREYYSTLEETRAELVALWHFGDRKLVEVGLLPGPEALRAAYEYYARLGLTQLRRLPEGERIVDDHMRAIQLITSYLREEGERIRVVESGGKVYFSVPDPEAMRRGIGDLLARIMRIKGEGDFRAARDLVERYAVAFRADWRDQVVERSRQAGIAGFTAFVMPDLVPVRGPDGGLEDVRMEIPGDFFGQQMSYSGAD